MINLKAITRLPIILFCNYLDVSSNWNNTLFTSNNKKCKSRIKP